MQQVPENVGTGTGKHSGSKNLEQQPSKSLDFHETNIKGNFYESLEDESCRDDPTLEDY